MSLSIGSSVLAIHVIEHRRCNHCVIQTRIEDALICRVIGLYINLSELLVPCIFRRCYYGVEVPTRWFLLKILTGIVDAYTRNTYLYHEWLAGSLKRKYTQRVSFLLLMGNGLWELGYEKDALILSPALGKACSYDGVLTFLFHRTVCHLVPSNTLWEVENYVFLTYISWKRVTMEGSTWCSGKLNTHSIGHSYRVISRCCILCTMWKLHLTRIRFRHR